MKSARGVSSEATLEFKLQHRGCPRHAEAVNSGNYFAASSSRCSNSAMRRWSRSKSSGLVKKSSACIATVRLVTSLDSALMKMIGIFLVDGWRRRISQTDRPSRSGSKISSRIRSGLELPRLAQRLHAVAGHDEFAAQPGEAILHQLDEIALVVHNQNSRHHAASLSQRRAKTNGRPVKAR